jgi:hypothetical protein
MEQSSNAENQARYRKKEQLRRQADQLLCKWQLEPWKHKSKSLQEVHHLIESAIKLPFKWTDEDYLNAQKKLRHVYSEIVSPVNQISNDVHESRNAYEEFGRSSLTRAVENTNALAAHIISALTLSGCTDADQAAALMEAMRFVGRNLTNNREVPCSQATAMCLSTISPIYGRPNWFYEKLAYIISQQHPELAHKIIINLTKYTGACHDVD